MVRRPTLNRRTFLEASAGVASGFFLSGASGVAAPPDVSAQAGGSSAAKRPVTGSTKHFWYRTQPAGPFVDSQRDNKAFGYTKDRVYLSEDNAHTWPHSLVFPDARHIVFSCILKNGNILFSALSKLYLSRDNLASYEQITVQNQDGTPYLPHKPLNPDRPGWYFHSLSGENTWDVHGREMLVWGNYCNVIDGATPVNIYYSTDNGRTVKIAYSFGQNPYFRDDGSGGGGRTGTLLGDAANPVICRHVHCVMYNPVEDAFYASTGDHDKPEGHECHWLRGTYDVDRDRWDWRVIVSDASNSRYKCGGISFVDGQVYWISDSNGPKPYDRGIFRCDPGDITHPDRHTRLYNPEVESGNMIIQDSVILASHCAPASTLATGLIISTDLGKTWAQYDLKELGRRSPCRIHRKNAEGWFRMDLRTSWVTPGEMLFLKPK